ncbi:predicted protein [Sclerotinia sclerotiorum 1980 UF-70]|uniref:Uncharacterized protein n=1 Tax=Sclerotinia sclerotiorum (strain ATCC 18683 / 1980 / Ss-1) TaxID=665079 RepID=A7ECD3_SCLS1|nr:predicted protein [Sclerotinia sclerotiorum 1980 UF-70]EDO00112.1 predicted protein [Sclerotinia sclerotiorum 1980 UF-70]
MSRSHEVISSQTQYQASIQRTHGSAESSVQHPLSFIDIPSVIHLHFQKREIDINLTISGKVSTGTRGRNNIMPTSQARKAESSIPTVSQYDPKKLMKQNR